MMIVPALPHGLIAALPHPSANTTRPADTPIVVQILSARDGAVSYKINQDDVAIDDLGSRLSALLSVRAEKVFTIRGDSNVDFSTVARVMDVGKGAGADHVGLITLTTASDRP